MSNPYAAPSSEKPRRREPGPLPPPQEPGLAGQIRVVAVLMMVQGFFEVAFGAVLSVMAFVFPAALAAMVAADPQAQQEGGPSPEVAARMMMVIYLVMGLAGVVPGIVHLAAGFRNVQYRGRTFGMTALCLGLGTLPIFICLPTALLLAAYGMVVYLQPSSAKAFEMGDQGYSAEAIYATFFAAAPPKAV
jgi:hypothetical protein